MFVKWIVFIFSIMLNVLHSAGVVQSFIRIPGDSYGSRRKVSWSSGSGEVYSKAGLNRTLLDLSDLNPDDILSGQGLPGSGVRQLLSC